LAVGGHFGELLIAALVGAEEEHTAVEGIGPADIGNRGKADGKVEKLIGGPKSDHIGINVHDFGELGETEDLDLGEGVTEVGTAEEGEVADGGAGHTVDGDDVVVDVPKAADGILGHSVGGDDDSELLFGSGITEGVGKHDGTNNIRVGHHQSAVNLLALLGLDIGVVGHGE